MTTLYSPFILLFFLKKQKVANLVFRLSFCYLRSVSWKVRRTFSCTQDLWFWTWSPCSMSPISSLFPPTLFLMHHWSGYFTFIFHFLSLKFWNVTLLRVYISSSSCLKSYMTIVNKVCYSLLGQRRKLEAITFCSGLFWSIRQISSTRNEEMSQYKRFSSEKGNLWEWKWHLHNTHFSSRLLPLCSLVKLLFYSLPFLRLDLLSTANPFNLSKNRSLPSPSSKGSNWFLLFRTQSFWKTDGLWTIK